MAVLLNIPVGEIRENSAALRSVNRQSEEFIALVGSIKERGVLNAISVRQLKDAETGVEYYELVDGLHRFTAACEAGCETIPAQVLDLDQLGVLEAQIIANVHKIETRPVDYSKSLQRVMALNPVLTVGELATKLAKSPSWINERLGLLKLCDTVAKLVNDGKINITNAYALAKLPPEEQPDWVDRAINQAPQEFCAAANTRAREVKDARRKGTDEAAVGFTPSQRLQKLALIKQEFEKPEILKALIAEQGINDPFEAAKLAIAWILHMDPMSIAADERKWNEQKAAKEAEKAAKAKEREAKKLADAAKEAVAAGA